MSVGKFLSIAIDDPKDDIFKDMEPEGGWEKNRILYAVDKHGTLFYIEAYGNIKPDTADFLDEWFGNTVGEYDSPLGAGVYISEVSISSWTNSSPNGIEYENDVELIGESIEVKISV